MNDRGCAFAVGFIAPAEICRLRGTDACEPCLELGQVGNLAAEADVAVGADGHQSPAERAHQPVDRDVGPEEGEPVYIHRLSG